MITAALALAYWAGAPVAHLFILALVGDIAWMVTRGSSKDDY